MECCLCPVPDTEIKLHINCLQRSLRDCKCTKKSEAMATSMYVGYTMMNEEDSFLQGTSFVAMS